MKAHKHTHFISYTQRMRKYLKKQLNRHTRQNHSKRINETYTILFWLATKRVKKNIVYLSRLNCRPSSWKENCVLKSSTSGNLRLYFVYYTSVKFEIFIGARSREKKNVVYVWHMHLEFKTIIQRDSLRCLCRLYYIFLGGCILN